MSSKRKLFPIYLLILTHSTLLFAAIPKTKYVEEIDVDKVKSYIFANITTTTNVIEKKDDNGAIIRSIPGAVLASPSNKGVNFSQDYQFHWTRDAALTMNEIAYLYARFDCPDKEKLKTYLLNYITFESKAQKQPSHPGEQTLGQPKFNIDSTVWEGVWGRPQNDGPALRAMTITHIANIFLQEGNEKFVRDQLLDIITTDLDYVVTEWKNSTYDLWEEVNDPDHFFTKMVQRKALLNAATLLIHFDKTSQANVYIDTAHQMTTSLQKHWNSNLGYFSETIQQQSNKGGGLDSSIILGVLYGDLSDSKDPLALTNDQVMSSVYYLRDAFAKLYKINWENYTKPPLIGRYPSDVYDGDQFTYGNPWVLATNALAQYYYSLAYAFESAEQIQVTKLNFSFFQQMERGLVSQGELITLAGNRQKFISILYRLIDEGDQIINNLENYAACYPDNNSCYRYAEQIDRNTGQQVSAKDLTWGYVTLLTALQARQGIKT